jgi:hypothetical protein
MTSLNATESELYKKLKVMAFQRSNPFCYECYKVAPNGVCQRCHSDDLMREMPGVGLEYGVDWVIDHILEVELNSIDEKQYFEDSLDGCYPETTTIGFITYDTITAMKELDPVTFQMAQSEHLDFERDDGRIVSFDNGSTFYSVDDVEELVREIDED